MATSRICAIEGCGKPYRASGWCMAHYKRYLRHGSATAGRVSNGSLMRYLDEVVMAYEGNDCLLWPFGSRSGRPTIRIKGKGHLVARLVCERVHGAPPSDTHHAAHWCGKGEGGCITKNHLRWATPVENSFDKFAHGTAARALDAADVNKIRAIGRARTQVELAREFGVSPSLIGAVIRREIWKHLP